MSTAQRVAVITGASQGIGAALVQAFRSRNYKVVATSRSIKPAADSDFATVQGDVADPKTANLVFKEALDRFDRIDTLVNNAGIFMAKPFTAYSKDDYAAYMATNVTGFFHMTQRAIETIGFLQRTSAGRKCSAERLRPPVLCAAVRKSARSLPAENAPGTPAIRTQCTESSAFAPSSAAVIASYMASVSAFFLSGRFIRMVRMPSASVTITCSVIKSVRLSDRSRR